MVNQMRYFDFWLSFKDIWVKIGFFQLLFFLFLKHNQLSVVLSLTSPDH